MGQARHEARPALFGGASDSRPAAVDYLGNLSRLPPSGEPPPATYNAAYPIDLTKPTSADFFVLVG